MEINLTAEKTRQVLLETLLQTYASQTALAYTTIDILTEGDPTKAEKYKKAFEKERATIVNNLFDHLFIEHGKIDLDVLYDK